MLNINSAIMKIRIQKLLFVIIYLFIFDFVGAQTTTTYTFEPSNSNILNPERGFYIPNDISSYGAFDVLDSETVAGYRSDSITLTYRGYYLEKFVNSDISSDYLDNMRKDFAFLRAGGVKAIVRFVYTDKYDSQPYGDAPIDIVLRHIEQLKPVLQENADVIFTVQAGFI